MSGHVDSEATPGLVKARVDEATLEGRVKFIQSTEQVDVGVATFQGIRPGDYRVDSVMPSGRFGANSPSQRRHFARSDRLFRANVCGHKSPDSRVRLPSTVA